jgi:hypothetical protein
MLFVSFASIPSGQGEDKVDLGVLPEHFMVDLEPLTEGSVPVTAEARNGELNCRMLMLGGSFTIQSRISAPHIVFGNLYVLANREKWECRWAMTPWNAFPPAPWPKWDNLQLVIHDEFVPDTINFAETGWNLSDPTVTKWVPKNTLPENGKLSLVYQVYVPGVVWRVHLYAMAKLITGLNLTLWLQETGGLEEEETNTLEVIFEGDWTQVEGNPELIFEAPSASDIHFLNSDGQPVDPPATVNIKKNAFVEGGTPEPESEKKGSKLATGAIVGIVIGGVAIIAIACVCVWYFVIRTPGEGVEGADAPRPE